ncbi:MAG: hypothetical protein RL486_1173, partial [Actinomycetota bacterium]
MFLQTFVSEVAYSHAFRNDPGEEMRKFTVLAGVGAISMLVGGSLASASPTISPSSILTLLDATTPGTSSAMVPSGICNFSVQAEGGAGGDGANEFGATVSTGGSGAFVAARFAVTPGSTIDVLVAGGGTDG